MPSNSTPQSLATFYPTIRALAPAPTALAQTAGFCRLRLATSRTPTTQAAMTSRPSSGPQPTQDTPVLTVTTALGGTFTFYFAASGAHVAGEWSYLTGTAGNESFSYVLVDGDGDQDTAWLSINVLPLPEGAGNDIIVEKAVVGTSSDSGRVIDSRRRQRHRSGHTRKLRSRERHAQNRCNQRVQLHPRNRHCSGDSWWCQ